MLFDWINAMTSSNQKSAIVPDPFTVWGIYVNLHTGTLDSKVLPNLEESKGFYTSACTIFRLKSPVCTTQVWQVHLLIDNEEREQSTQEAYYKNEKCSTRCRHSGPSYTPGRLHAAIKWR